MNNKKYFFVLLLFLVTTASSVFAQRIQQRLDRGVVAVKNGTSVFISWRKLAQEPENAKYNVYTCAVGSEQYTKINSSPLSVTNTTTTTANVPVGNEIVVALVVDGEEQAKSLPFLLKNHSLRSTFLDITYEKTVVPYDGFVTKFVWPADLDGDGEFDYVVDRISTGTETDKIQGYLRDGTYLWTIDMGPNVIIDRGHNDMVLAYDMNCDGKAEVVIKSSDGTRFWDSANNTYGEYLLGKEDTDGDGIIDYSAQSTKNPPQYITCIDGMTGKELNTIEFDYSKIKDGSNSYSRTNKSTYMDEEYSKLNGHMGVCYLDGIHPSISMEYMVRDAGGTHHYYVSAWGYNFANGVATDWVERFTWARNNKTPWPAEFHHIRIGDVDLDGKDEILDGGFAVDDDGTMLFSAGISHGDRFRMSDINPDRPGLETYAIQQNAGDMLGDILYDAATGTSLIRHYLSAVGDVGRGECMDVNKAYKGYEFWSTMGTLYSCDNQVISTSVPFPREGMWWDGELDREMLSAPDGNGYNAMVQKYDGTRLIEIAKISSWALMSEYGCRPLFFGDIVGDWRDEVILRRGTTANTSGIVGFSTDYSTTYSMYCLQEDPAYRLQCTTRGYYQSPFPAFYLGYDMPYPPLPPCMVTDLVWNGGGEWGTGVASFTDYARSQNVAFANGKSVLFDLGGLANNTVTLNQSVSPSVVYAMPPVGQQYTLNGSGTLEGDMQLWKSQNGTFIINTPLTYTGKTVVSEGTLELNTTLNSPLELRAKGTLSGNAILNDTVIFEGALNYEGCRFKPGSEVAPFGVITFNKNLTLNKKVYFEIDLQTADEAKNDKFVINGDVKLTTASVVNFVPAEAKPAAGEYVVMTWTGNFTGDVSNFTVSGLVGLSYDLTIVDKSLVLIIHGQRNPSDNVSWTGAESNIWDYQTENFFLDGASTAFVADDKVLFDDNATTTSIVMNELIPTSGVTFANETSTYLISGNGGFSGTGGLTKTGAGKLTLSSINSDYTGATILSGGTVTVKALADGGAASSLGAASTDAANLQLERTTLVINNTNTATNRGITLTDTTTINVASGTSSLKGIIKGTGTLVKTGAGQLNITYAGSNTYTGGTILKAGTLAMGAYNTTFGKSGGKLQLEGGTVQIFDNNSTSAVPNLNYAITVPEGKSVNLNAGDRCQINGSFSGGGTVKLYLPYVRADMKANWANFTGALSASGNQFRLCAAMDMSGTAVTLGEVTMGHFSSGSANALSATSKLGSLSSTTAEAYLVNGTYNIGYNNQDATYAGVLSGVTVNKYGTGKWTLTGASNSAITVNEGTLIISNTTAETTTGTITVNNGGTLAGAGKAKTVKINKGGILAASTGNYTMSNMSITGNCTLASGAVLYVKRRSIRNDSWSVDGKVTLSSPTINIEVVSGEFSAGDSLIIFKGDGTISLVGNVTFVPEVPGDGLQWNTDSLTTQGVIRVVAATGIRPILSENSPVNVYSITGRLLRANVPVGTATQGLEKGIYIVNGEKVLVNP